MILIIGTVKLPVAKLDAARPFMAAMIEASRAEDGCLEYVYAADVLDPGLIHVKERWSDQAALLLHFQTAHVAAWRLSWPSLGIGERALYSYEVGIPKPI
jgi:quinol monooxygenase YgiN